MPACGAPLLDDPPRGLDHGDDRRLVVGAEDRPARVPDDAVLDDHGLERAVERDRVEVRAEEERRAALGRRREAAEDVPASTPEPLGRVVLLPREPEPVELRRDPVGDRPLLARRARDRAELEEEVEKRRRGWSRGRSYAGIRAVGARQRQAVCDADAVARAALERRADELAEERRRPRRPRLELRVELARDEPRVVGQLDDLDEPSLLERPGDDEPVLDELLAVAGC